MSRLFVISGPSGVGKGTLIAKACEARPDLWLSISTTSRQPRPGEQDGVQYRFVTRAEFETGITQGDFLEWAEYAGNYYGTSRPPVLAHLGEGRSVLLEIDLQGARQVRTSHPEAVLIMITPPSTAELAARLRSRATDDEATVERRLGLARHELAAADEFDHVLVNSDIAESSEQLLQLLDS